MIKFLSRGLRKSTIATILSPFPSSSFAFLHSKSCSSSPFSTVFVAGNTASELADITGEENLSASSAVKPKKTPFLLQPGVVVYDGVCHLCHRGVKWIVETDKNRKIKFCCLQSKAAEPYLTVCGLDRQDVLRRFLFVEGPGLYHQGSTAALRVLSHLPLPYSALSFLLVIPTPIRDLVYDYVARHRYEWFGKGDNCLVLQEKELLDRFIDREEMMDGAA